MLQEQPLKQQAADEVLKHIKSGMIVGLGAGSTAMLAVRGLAAPAAVVDTQLNQLNRFLC